MVGIFTISVGNVQEWSVKDLNHLDNYLQSYDNSKSTKIYLLLLCDRLTHHHAQNRMVGNSLHVSSTHTWSIFFSITFPKNIEINWNFHTILKLIIYKSDLSFKGFLLFFRLGKYWTLKFPKILILLKLKIWTQA